MTTVIALPRSPIARHPAIFLRRGAAELQLSRFRLATMFDLFRKEVLYEDYGYMRADSLLPELIEQPARSADEWAGVDIDTEEVARQLAILCSAFQHFCHIGLVSDDAGYRILQGMMKRFDERFSDFSSDSMTTEAISTYLRAAASDIKDKSKSESFPTLVPTVIVRITGVQPSDSRCHSSSEVVYSILDAILKTSEPSLIGTQKHAKLV